MDNPLKYTCLFGGGAIRGLAYVGTIRALEELGIEYDILGGSSVGSILAALIAKGYKSFEIEKIFMKVNFNLFKDIHFGIGNGIALSKGERFLEWLNSLLSPKDKTLQFKDLNKELVIITTNLTKFCSQEFSLSKTPDFDVSQAIKISSSMPGLMAPYKYEDSHLVDGDLQKASPMWRLSSTINNSKSRILEFRLEGDYNCNENNPISYINTIYSCVTDVATDFVNELYGNNDRYDCIKINTGDIFFADFNLGKEERRKLIELGYQQTKDYFEKVLPVKKRKLLKLYSLMHKYLKNTSKNLAINNVDEVQWWLGQLCTVLCEYKDVIDPIIYNQIIDFKNEIINSMSKFLFFYTCFKSTKKLKTLMSNLLFHVETRIEELQFYIANRQSS